MSHHYDILHIHYFPHPSQLQQTRHKISFSFYLIQFPETITWIAPSPPPTHLYDSKCCQFYVFVRKFWQSIRLRPAPSPPELGKFLDPSVPGNYSTITSSIFNFLFYLLRYGNVPTITQWTGESRVTVLAIIKSIRLIFVFQPTSSSINTVRIIHARRRCSCQRKS